MKNQTFILEIISPTKVEKISIIWVEIESPTGSFLVAIDHSPLISVLKKQSLLTYKTDNSKKLSREIYGGMFEVSGNLARVILEQ